jgi:hypothetical protein
MSGKFASRTIASSLRAAIGLAALFLASLPSGCASSESDRSDPAWIAERSHADGAAYGADNFTFRKPSQPRRPAAEAFQFFYKSCSADDGRSYYSKTSYVCTGPW